MQATRVVLSIVDTRYADCPSNGAQMWRQNPPLPASPSHLQLIPQAAQHLRVHQRLRQARQQRRCAHAQALNRVRALLGQPLRLETRLLGQLGVEADLLRSLADLGRGVVGWGESASRSMIPKVGGGGQAGPPLAGQADPRRRGAT